MQPDLELVHVRKGESFAAWMHGYPFRTVRWHYHPEYEIHLIVATSGRYFIGDFAGTFSPGQLIVTGPNLPQNWISDVPADEVVPVRSIVIQFPEHFIQSACETIAEMQGVPALLERSRRGLLFDQGTSTIVAPLMRQLVEAQGLRRLVLFWDILHHLTTGEHEVLASLSYEPNLSQAGDSGINRALAHLREHLTRQVEERELADIVGQSPSVFSRAFKRHTGTTLVRYRNQLRIDLACKMLLTEPGLAVATICYEVGFSNLSNFNRHFLKLKGMSPSQFRANFAANRDLVIAD